MRTKLERHAMACALFAILSSFVVMAYAASLHGVPLPAIDGPIPVSDTSHVWNGAEWQWVHILQAKYGYVEQEYYVSGIANVYDVLANSRYRVKALRSAPTPCALRSIVLSRTSISILLQRESL